MIYITTDFFKEHSITKNVPVLFLKALHSGSDLDHPLVVIMPEMAEQSTSMSLWAPSTILRVTSIFLSPPLLFGCHKLRLSSEFYEEPTTRRARAFGSEAILLPASTSLLIVCKIIKI